jgi:hypothetical protein
MTSTTVADQALLGLLASGVPTSAAALARLAGVSQPTLSRALARLSPLVLRSGAARSTRYAAKYDMLGLSATQPAAWRVDRLPAHACDRQSWF